MQEETDRHKRTPPTTADILRKAFTDNRFMAEQINILIFFSAKRRPYPRIFDNKVEVYHAEKQKKGLDPYFLGQPLFTRIAAGYLEISI